MKVSPMAIVRALVTRLSADERLALVGELLDGAAAARSVRASVVPPVLNEEE